MLPVVAMPTHSPNLFPAMVFARDRASSGQSKQSGLNPAAFRVEAANLPVGGNSAATATADFNRDGVPDLVVALASPAISNNLAVFLGSGNGSFGSPLLLSANGLSSFSVVTGDFNGDGNSDIVTANFGSDTVSLLLGNGNGSFQAAQTFQVGKQPNQVVTADLNQDGRLDLVTANSGSNTLSVLLGSETGFRSGTNFRTKGTQPFAVATGDFDRDGKLDLISADAASNGVSLFLGRGNGEFSDPKSFIVGSTSPVAIVTGDFDGDKRLDLVTGNLAADGRDISILFGDGKGDFPRGITLPAGGGVNSLIAADFNQDGQLDLAGLLNLSATMVVFLGDGEGGFTRAPDTFVGSAATDLSIADFNQDNKLDLVSASLNSTNASVILNKTTAVVLRSTKTLALVDGSQETAAGMTVNLDRGTLVVKGNPVVRVSVDGFNDVEGTQVKDGITGSDKRNLLSGNDGADRLIGLGGNDVLTGGAGPDRLEGGTGNDQLTGGIGRDRLTSGAGRDRFIFDHQAPFSPTDGQDRLTDFEKGRDKIVLDRGTFTALSGKISFASVQTLAQAKTNAALVTYVRSTGRLYYNPNGTEADFGSGGWFATLERSKSANGNLTASDFLTQR
nr:MAG: hypothetical protein EDM05_22565 [Leptolyngbya sp. IPPAS B-1204]